MKKSVYSIIVAGLALVSAACQKLDEQIVAPGSSNGLTVTASIVNFDGTKVSYAFSDPENVKSGIKPSWTVGDAIFGFDDNGGTFSFTVSSITDGKATFSTTGYSPVEGTKLYAVYYPDKNVSDLENNALSVDLSSQSGKLDGNAPVIMCATGEIKNNAVSFNFTNQTAIVGIYKMQVYNDGATVGEGKAVTAVTLSGARTKGQIKVVGDDLKLVASDDGLEGITATELDLTTEADGYVNVDPEAIAPYFAVIPAESASLSIEATCGGITCATNASITGAINAGQYYYLGKKVYGGTVATIGTDEYATISEAFAAATDGQTIQLEKNCIFDSQITLAGKTGTITLNLNGCTLTNGPTLNNKQSRIYLNNEDVTLVITDTRTGGKILGKASQDVVKVIEGNLTVASGTIEAPASVNGGNAAICVEGSAEASVTIQGTASIKGPASVTTTDKHAYALYVENPNAAISVTGGTFSAESNSMRVIDAKRVDITGGTFTSGEGQFTLRFASSGKNYTCNISGDAVVNSNKTNAVRAYGDEGLTVEISGGKYNSGAGYIPVNTEVKEGTDGPTISITGGLYSRKPKDEFVAENYACIDNKDPKTCATYPYKVAVPVTLTVGSGDPVNCKSVEAAVAEVNKEENKTKECTITLLESITVGVAANVENSAGVTLDLNGKTLQQDGKNARIKPSGSGKLIITDNGTNGTITQTNTASSTFTLDAGGTLIINNGIITKPSSSAGATITVSNGTLTVMGGLISNTATKYTTVSIEGESAIVNIGTEDEGDAKITADGINSDNSATPAVALNKGTLTLNKGTIGNTGSKGNYVALRINSGSFTMNGGNLTAQRFPIYFNTTDGNGSAIINNANEIRNTYGGYNTIRFPSTAPTGSITFEMNGGYLFSPDYTPSSGTTVSGTLFGTGKFRTGSSDLTNTEVPDNVSVTVNRGYFNKDFSDYSGKITLGNVETGVSEKHNGITYTVKVTPNQ